MPRHFLTGAELDADRLRALLDRALELKADPGASDALAGRQVALVFERPSTRTRVTFEVGIRELGGDAVVLRADELQLARGESPRDTALVLSRHVAAIGVRTGPDTVLEELAEHASVPVFNMLTTGHHPCQALADLLTLRETFDRLDGLVLAYVGDGNNVARSLAVLGALSGVEVRVAAPPGYQLEPVAGAVRAQSAPAGSGGSQTGASAGAPTGVRGATGARCLPASTRLGVRGAGPVRLGDTRARMLRRAGAPTTIRRSSYTYCRRGGGRVIAVFAHGRARLVILATRGRRVRSVGDRSLLRRAGL